MLNKQIKTELNKIAKHLRSLKKLLSELPTIEENINQMNNLPEPDADKINQEFLEANEEASIEDAEVPEPEQTGEQVSLENGEFNQ